MNSYRYSEEFTLLTLLWGTTFTAVEIGLSTLPPVLFMALRFDLAGILMLAYVILTADNYLPATRGDALAIAAGGILWTAVSNGIWYIGQDLTTSVFSALMTSLIPVMTTAFSWLILPEDRLSPLSIVGLGIGFIGALIIMVPPGEAVFTASLVGKAILLAGGIGVSLGSVLIRYADSSLSSTAQTAWSIVLGAVLLHSVSPILGETWSGGLTIDAGLALAYLAVFSTVLAYLLYFSMLQRRPAIELTLVLYLLPIVAGTAGWLLFGEPVTLSMISGFLVVISGFSLMKRKELRAELERYGIVG